VTRGTQQSVTTILIVLGVVAYAWIATSVRPFTTHAYAVVAAPSLAALLFYASLGGFSKRTDIDSHYRARSSSVTWRSVAPWIAIVLLAIALESLGLALGGRSSIVPTLSTTVDHLLVHHWERWVLFAVWMAAGASPLRHLYLVRRGTLRSLLGGPPR
jgi:4-amino-4-deoxy-L-arabinose transferase-like glycosyltransferase